MRHVTAPTALALVAALLFVGGCEVSSDQHVFESTQLHPANVAVIDTVDGRQLWRMEVPVGHQLEVDLDRTGLEREGTRISSLPADQLTWYLYDIVEPYHNPEEFVGEAVAEDTVMLSGNPVRLQVTYRGSSAISGEGLYRIEQLYRPSELGSETAEPTEAEGAAREQAQDVGGEVQERAGEQASGGTTGPAGAEGTAQGEAPNASSGSNASGTSDAPTTQPATPR